MKKILLIFLLLIFKNSMMAQTVPPTDPNDCVNAIVVCGSGPFNSNANNFGKQEIAGCNNSKEHNSLWIKINIVQSGKLGFDLIPDDPDLSADFDFWVFGANKSCSNLGSPIRCCITNPVEAGLTDNHTGMNATTLATTAWSGGVGNNLPYVRSLDVIAGEFYYIAIDRPYTTPSGKTGFQIQWTGTATAGAGAFPTPPTANKIPDLVTCSITPNVGIFDLNVARSQINSDLTNNTITFHTSLANAVDGKSPLPNIYGNTSNPQTIYARVVNNVGGCLTTTDFNLRVFEVPSATIDLLKTPLCPGENVTVIFKGTAGATVDYQVNGGVTKSVLLDATGEFQLNEPVSATQTYKLILAKIVDGNNAVVCSQSVSDSETVTISPAAAISGILVMCENATSQLTGSGTPDIVTPWISSDTTVATVSATGLVTGIAAGTSDITYTNSNGCSATSTVTINSSPTISGKPSICASSSTQLTATGTPAASNPWISSDPSIATVNSSGLVSGVSVGTVTITYTDTTGCSDVFSLQVTASNSTQSATAEVSNFFENQTITVTVVGDATYLYSLDGGAFQPSNVFSNVSPGLHSVTINDTDGCTDITIDDILAIGYPHFFTPNGDEFNATWNIWSLADLQPNSEIRIFDRFGKLLKVMTPADTGWDGTYNEHTLPSTDYWFTVRYIENNTEKIFKGHFSLKR